MKNKTISTCLFLFAGISALSFYSLAAEEKTESKKEAAIKSIATKVNAEEVYELRKYTTPDGKLPYLHKRFRDHTLKLFAKHGMVNVIYFTPVDKPNTLVYLLKHKSRDAAKVSWKNFLKDEDWKAAYKKSIANGRLVVKIESTFLKTTDYSPQK